MFTTLSPNRRRAPTQPALPEATLQRPDSIYASPTEFLANLTPEQKAFLEPWPETAGATKHSFQRDQLRDSVATLPDPPSPPPPPPPPKTPKTHAPRTMSPLHHSSPPQHASTPSASRSFRSVAHPTAKPATPSPPTQPTAKMSSSPRPSNDSSSSSLPVPPRTPRPQRSFFSRRPATPTPAPPLPPPPAISHGYSPSQKPQPAQFDDLQRAESIASSTSTASPSIPQPYGGRSNRARSRTISSQDSSTPPGSVEPDGSPGTRPAGSFLMRLKSKVSLYSLRSDSRSAPNAAEPIPPLPVRTENSMPKRTGGSTMKTPQTPTPKPSVQPTSNSPPTLDPAPTTKKGRHVPKPPFAGRSFFQRADKQGKDTAPPPVAEPEVEAEPKPNYFEDCDFDNMDPSEFMEFRTRRRRRSVSSSGSSSGSGSSSSNPSMDAPVIPPPGGLRMEEWQVPDSWAVQTEEAIAKEEGLESDAEQPDEGEEAVGGVVILENDDWLNEEYDITQVEDEAAETDTEDEVIVIRGGVEGQVEEDVKEEEKVPLKYVLRVYRPGGLFHVVACPLTGTAQEIRNSVVELFGLEHEGGKGRFRLFISEKGQERMLYKKEKPALMLKRRLLTAGYTAADSLPSQGGRNFRFLARFVLQESKLTGLKDEFDGMFGDREHVILKDVNLQIIPPALHKHAERLLTLNMDGNPLTDIPADFIQAAVRLKQFSLSKTALKRVPPALRFAKTLRMLDMSYNRLTDLRMERGGLHELKELQGLNVQNNSISSLPAEFAACSRLFALNLASNRFQQIPDVIWGFKELEILDLNYNALTELPAGIGNLKKLKKFSIAGNNLTELPDAIMDCAILEEVNIRRNAITDITLLGRLKCLKELRAERNLISAIDMALPSSVVLFELGSNAFARFAPICRPLDSRLEPPSRLSRLILSHTKLSSLNEFDFTLVPSLQDLFMDDTGVHELPQSITTLSGLELLSCSNGSLTRLPDALGGMKALTELMVFNNNLTGLPDTIWQCPKLRKINASSNVLAEWPALPGAMSGSPKVVFTPPLAKCLEELCLMDNRLKEASLPRLGLLTGLTSLNLSWNHIREVPVGSIRKLKNLESLYLSGNGMSVLRGDVLPHSRGLRRLYLNANKLQSLPMEVSKFIHLIVLDVSSNLLRYNINNFPYEYQWIFQPLKSLNLSGNKRFVIEKPKSRPTEGIQSNPADFRQLKRLQMLGLMDVTLSVTLIPDESDHCRVRTSASSVNGMRYGIADSYGEKGGLYSFDLVVPKFRGKDAECLLGMFSRVEFPASQDNSLVKYVHDHFVEAFTREVVLLNKERAGDVRDALRRSFLSLNKTFYDDCVQGAKLEFINIGEALEGNPVQEITALQSGASGLVAYLVDKTLYVANVGNIAAIVSRDSRVSAVLSTKHEPLDSLERVRLKNAESAVAAKGFLTDSMHVVSRGFGLYNYFPMVNAAPDVRTYELTKLDEFLIIGNSHFWDYVSHEQAVDVVRNFHRKGDAMIAAQELRDLAMGHGSIGNVMVMVVMLSDIFRTGSWAPSVDFEDALAATAEVFERRAGAPDISISSLDRMGPRILPPVGIVALVFTDIRNSTWMWDQLAAAMHSGIEIHNKCMRRLLRLHGGYEVKTEGDAFMVAFSSVLAAVRWCLDAQLQLMKEDWPIEILQCNDGKEIRDTAGTLIARGLAVRMGIGYGSPHCEPDPVTQRMDYFGPMVNRSARVSGNARGGEIMLSTDTLKELRRYMPLEDDTVEQTTDRDKLERPRPIIPTADEERHVDAIMSLDPVLRVVGEKMLKGIELPEYLSLLFPRELLGRHQLDVPVLKPVPTTQPGPVPPPVPAQPKIVRTLPCEKEQIQQIALVCMRLEAIAAGHRFRLTSEPDADSQPRTAEPAVEDGAATRPTVAEIARTERPVPTATTSGAAPPVVYGRAELLCPALGDDATDEDVLSIMGSLITRLEAAIKAVQLCHASASSDLQSILGALGMDASQLFELLCSSLGSAY